MNKPKRISKAGETVVYEYRGERITKIDTPFWKYEYTIKGETRFDMQLQCAVWSIDRKLDN